MDFVTHAPHVQRGGVQVSAFDVADSLVELVVGNDEVRPLQVVVEPMVGQLLTSWWSASKGAKTTLKVSWKL